MVLRSYAGLLTIQVGVTVVSAVMFSLASVMLIVNLSDNWSPDYDPYNIEGREHFREGSSNLNLLIMCITVVCLLFGGCTAFLSAYFEARTLAAISCTTIVALCVYWLIISVMSFANDPRSDAIASICINNRCPETLWLARLHYKPERWPAVHVPGRFYGKGNNSVGNNVARGYSKSDASTKTEEGTPHVSAAKQEPYRLWQGDPRFPYWDSRSEIDGHSEYTSIVLSLTVSICLFVVNLSFFVHSAFVLWSWVQELSSDDDDDPYYVAAFQI